MKSRYKLRMIRLLILFALLIIADRHYQCNVEAANITELKKTVTMRMSTKRNHSTGFLLVTEVILNTEKDIESISGDKQ